MLCLHLKLERHYKLHKANHWHQQQNIARFVGKLTVHRQRQTQNVRVAHGTYLSVPSHSNLCLSHTVGFPLHYYYINMECNSIKIIKVMKV